MLAHDRGALWRHCSAELESADRALLDEHLSGCPECREELELIRNTRALLRNASLVRPAVDWNRVDEELGAKVARQMLKGRGGWLRPALAFAAGVALVVGAAAVLGVWQRPEQLALPAPVMLAGPVEESRASQVAQAHLRRAGVEGNLDSGAALREGDVLSTGAKGQAVVDLPDRSRMRLGASSELVLVRSSEQEIALRLRRGRIAVKAQHSPERPFQIDAGGLLVRVVGTSFTVRSTAREVEVAVAEGVVRVEPELGAPLTVRGGQRIRLQREGWQARRGDISPAQREELVALGAPSPGPNPTQTMVEAALPKVAPHGPGAPAAGATTAGAATADAADRRGASPRLLSTPGHVTSTAEASAVAAEGGSPHPLSMPGQVRSLAKDPAASAAEGASPHLLATPGHLRSPVEEPAASAAEGASPHPHPPPAADGASPHPLFPPGAGPATGPASAEHAPSSEEWLPFQPAAPATGMPPETAALTPAQLALEPDLPPAGPSTTSGPSLPLDVESLFLRKAEDALVSGLCQRFLLGLSELIEGSESLRAQERARILRARCYNATLRSAEADREYRLYLQGWPQGRWVEEAKGATEER